MSWWSTERLPSDSPSAGSGNIRPLDRPARTHCPVGDDPSTLRGGLDRRTEYDHGDQCACLLLAAAVGAGRDAVSFTYCVNVLQKHWDVRCNHGAHCHERAPAWPADDFHQSARLDKIQAILVRER